MTGELARANRWMAKLVIDMKVPARREEVVSACQTLWADSKVWRSRLVFSGKGASINDQISCIMVACT
jgi:hypothetical protein